MGLEIPSRRGFITGLIAFAAVAPAIVRPENLMKIRSMAPVVTGSLAEHGMVFADYYDGTCLFFDGVRVLRQIGGGEFVDITGDWYAETPDPVYKWDRPQPRGA